MTPEKENEELIGIINDKSVDKDVLEVYKKFYKYMTPKERKAWITRRDECWNIIENNIWTEDEKTEIKDKDQVPVRVQKCNKGVQSHAAIVTDNKPQIKVHPISDNDLYLAELIKRAIDFIWEKNDGSGSVYDLVEERDIGGLGFIDVWVDKSIGVFGSIEFEESPPDDFYFDKNSRKPDFSDTDLIKAKLRTREYIRDHYDDISDDDMAFMTELKVQEEGTKSTGVTGADNYKLPDDDVDRQEKRDMKFVWEIEAWLLKTDKEDWIIQSDTEYRELTPEDKQQGESYEDACKRLDGIYWPRVLTKREQRIIVGKKLISSEVNPLGIDADGNPVMPKIAYRAQRTRSAYPISPTYYCLDVQKELCKRHMQGIASASESISPPIVEPENVKWIGKPGNPGSRCIVPKNVAFEPKRMISQNLDFNNFVVLEERDNNYILDQYDSHDVVRGKMPQGSPSGRVVLALQDMAGTMSKPSLRLLEAALVRLAKVVIAMALKYWPRMMWERLIDEEEMFSWTPDGMVNNDPREANFNSPENVEIKAKWQAALKKLDVLDGGQQVNLMDLDIKFTAGSSLPTNRMAKNEIAIDLFAKGLYDREAALEFSEDPNKDRIIKRMKSAEAMSARLAGKK